MSITWRTWAELRFRSVPISCCGGRKGVQLHLDDLGPLEIPRAVVEIPALHQPCVAQRFGQHDHSAPDHGGLQRHDVAHLQEAVERQVNVGQLDRTLVHRLDGGQLVRHACPEQDQPVLGQDQPGAVDIVGHPEICGEIQLDMPVPMRLGHHHGFKDTDAKTAEGAEV